MKPVLVLVKSICSAVTTRGPIGSEALAFVATASQPAVAEADERGRAVGAHTRFELCNWQVVAMRPL